MGFGGVLLLLIMFLGAGVALYRYANGLGATTNLNDFVPWGLWIGLDVLCGVALAAGAFTMALTFYILNMKKYKPLVRPAILTGFLGYGLVIVALMLDLGRPWNIWRPLIFPQFHSVMFEVGTCVAIYTTVLALEFSPLFFERFNIKAPLKLIKAITIPLVIAGVILSTLHQSSLGSLYLLVPGKLNPLWYSALLPVYFLISAIGAGLAVVIVEATLSTKLLKKEEETHLLSSLAKAIPYVLGLYLIIKVIDLAVSGKFGLVFSSGNLSVSYLIEICGGVILPILLLSSASVRKSASGLFWSCLLVIGGLVLNRLNVSMIGLEYGGGATYFPSWMEFAITASIIAALLFLFGLIAKNFPVFQTEEGKA